MPDPDLFLIRRALDTAEAFFRHRDEMNADVHLAETRYSPITVLVGEARDAAYRLLPQAEGHDLRPLPIVDGRTAEQLAEDGDDRWPDGRPYIPPTPPTPPVEGDNDETR
jgi:hypothetical protein